MKRNVVFGKISKFVMVLENAQLVEYANLAEFNAEVARRNELARKGDWDNLLGAEYFTKFVSNDGAILGEQSGVSPTHEVGSPAYRVVCDTCHETVLWYLDPVDADGNTDTGFNVYDMEQVSMNCETCTTKAEAPYNEPVDFSYHM